MTLIMALSLFSTLAIGMMPAYLSAKPQKLPSDGRSCSAEKETGLAILSTILGALLPMVVSILLGFVAAALQCRVAQEEAASSVFLSVVGSIVTMGVFIALTH